MSLENYLDIRSKSKVIYSMIVRFSTLLMPPWYLKLSNSIFHLSRQSWWLKNKKIYTKLWPCSRKIKGSKNLFLLIETDNSSKVSLDSQDKVTQWLFCWSTVLVMLQIFKKIPFKTILKFYFWTTKDDYCTFTQIFSSLQWRNLIKSSANILQDLNCWSS